MQSPRFFQSIIVDGFGRVFIRKLAQAVEPGFPAQIIKVFQQAVPFPVGIVAQPSFVCGMAVALGGNLYARVPFQPIFFCAGVS